MSTTKREVIAWLRENADERGIEHWKRRPQTLKSYGIGLTRLRKYAKQVGRDHKLAQLLWKSDVYEAKDLFGNNFGNLVELRHLDSTEANDEGRLRTGH